MIKDKKPYLWILGLGVLTYLWTVVFKFSYFDDNTLILDNLSFLRNLGNIPTAFTTEVFHSLHASAAYYRPLLTLSLMFDAQLSGSNPFLYHLTNIVIHLVTSCLLYIFLNKISIKRDTSLLLSIIFAVHPILTQAVAWIPGRNDSLLTLFALLSLIYFVNYFSSNKPRDLLLHILFFGAAIFTKESGLLIIPAVFLYIILFGKWKFIIEKIHIILAWGVTFAAWFILRSLALPDPIRYSLTNIIKSVYLALPVVILDLGKTILPVNLSVLPTLQDSTLIWGFISLGIMLISLIFTKNKNYRMIIFGTVWFLMFLLPSFIRPNADYVPDFLEHRMYLPIIGLFIIFSQIKYIRDFDFTNTKSKIILGAVLTALVSVNFIHTSTFRDRLTFWKSAVISSPHHPLGHKNLGAMYYLDGNLDKAEEEYIKSLELNPQELMIHNNLGLIYADRGETERAEEEYKKELEINPNYDNALYNYGLLLYREKRMSEAEEMWLRTLEVNPNYNDAIKNLFILYYDAKDTKKANIYYNEVLRRGINLPLN